MGEKVIPLSQRYEAHGEAFEKVTIREPRFADLLEFGEPYEMQRAPGGVPVVIENTDTVAAYVRRCVMAPSFDKLAAIGLVDARKVREGVLSFFALGETPSGASQKRPDGAPTSSSSAAAGAPTT